jgi:flagellar hook-associated protein 2
MAGMNLSGLASGMDTDAVITQLMQIEAQGKTRLVGRQYESEGRKAALDQIATRLRTFKTATDELRSIASWANVQKVETGDAGKVGARFTGGAAVGSYSVEVTQLARADQQFFTYTKSAAASTISIASGTDAAVKIDIAADADAAGAAAAINAKAESPAFASVVNGELVLSGKKTGVNLTVTAAQAAPLDLKRRESRMAIFKIDGVEQPHSATNTVADGLAGVELSLKSLTTSAVTVSIGAPGPDQEALKTKVKAFVDSYNSVIDLVKGKLEEQRPKSPTTQADYAKGALRSDPGLSGLLSKLRGTMSEKVAGNPTGFDQLSDLGISVPTAQTTGAATADRLSGKLVIDNDKLAAALASDPVAVRRLMGGISGVDGATQKLDAILDPVARLGDGDLAQRSAMVDRDTTRIKDQQAQMDLRLALKEKRLRSQFTAMETALAASQNSQSWLGGQIAGLSSWS